MNGPTGSLRDFHGNSLLLWLIPLLFAQVGAITALVKLL